MALGQLRLDIVHPLVFIEEMGTSSNKPVLVRCVNESTGLKNDYVIKLKAGGRMDERAFMKESIASLMAIALGLTTPTPAIAEITEMFIESRN